MLKLSGVLDTKYQKFKRHMRMLKALNQKEFKHLVADALLSMVAMVFIYFGVLFIASKLLYPDSDSFMWQFQIRDRLGLTSGQIHFFRQVFTLLMLVLALWFTRWRISRRYKRIELQHVLNELDYIALGNYHHRISEDLVLRMGSVVSSINKLVDSTVRAMEEERRIEQTKQELIVNVSHDIRTPLTSVMGYLNLIIDKNYETEEELLEYATIAYNKSQQMKKMADNLFEYVSMHDYTNALTYQTVYVKHFLTQISVEYETEAKKHNMQIEVNVSNDKLQLSMDASKMVRVYDNILTNAFKYSGATQLVLEATETADTVVLHIKNNGKPIAKQAQEQVFMRFYREDLARTSQTGGAGLGLAIVESIVKHHNGTVGVVSTEGETTFSIILPKRSKHDYSIS